MSGAKRRTKYRKHVTQDFSDSERVPEEGELYAEIGQSHGGNIFGILTSEGVNTLARLPTKFRKLIWVKRGDMVIVSCAADEYETATGAVGRVTHSIEHILNSDQVKQFRKKLDSSSVFLAKRGAHDSENEANGKVEQQLAGDLEDVKISASKATDSNDNSTGDSVDDNDKASPSSKEQYEQYFFEEDNDDDIFVNRNRPVDTDTDDDSDSD